MTEIEQKRAFAKPTDNLEAYDYVLRGRQLLLRLQRATNFEARQLFRKAISLDPDYAAGYAGLGRTHFDAVLYGWTGSPQADIERTHALAQRAIAVDDSSALGHMLLGRVYLVRRQYDLALVELERAIALNPNDSETHGWQGEVLVWSGHPEGAILALETAQRFDPMMDPQRLFTLGLAYYLNHQYGDAVETLERSVGQHPDYVYGYTVLAATYGQMGRKEDAARAADAVRRLNPLFSTDEFGNNSLFRNPADAMRLDEGLRKAGLD